MLHNLKEKLQEKLHSSSVTDALARSVPVTDINYEGNSFNALLAGIELSDRTFNYFYSPKHEQFRQPQVDSSAADSFHGHAVRSVIIAFWSIADCAKRSGRREDMDDLSRAYAALEKFWQPDAKGYSSSDDRENSNKISFDDNVDSGNALVTAFQATGDSMFLDKAREVLTGVLSAPLDRSAGKPWHVNLLRTREASSTLPIAILACRLALSDVETDFCTDVARGCIQFAEELQIIEGAGQAAGSLTVEGEQWARSDRRSANVAGFAIEALLLWSQLSGDESYMDKATKLALKAVDPNDSLFDSTLQPQMRIWKDPTFLAHYLVDALVLVAAANGLQSPAGVQILVHLIRLAGFVRTHIYDPADHFYYEELAMYRIDQDRTDKFNKEFGANSNLEPPSIHGEGGIEAVEKRRPSKTLIANASVARLFLCISDVQREVPIQPDWMERYHKDAFSVGEGNNRPQKPLETV